MEYIQIMIGIIIGSVFSILILNKKNKEKKKKVIDNYNFFIKRLEKENKENRKKISSMINGHYLLQSTIHNIGSYIHYLDYEYTKKNLKITGRIFSIIGTILRCIASKPDRIYMSVTELSKTSSTIKMLIDTNEIPNFFEEIKYFTILELVLLFDCLSESDSDVKWKDCVKSINKKELIRKNREIDFLRIDLTKNIIEEYPILRDKI